MARMTGEELLRRYAAGERDFRGAELAGTDLRGAELVGGDFGRADVRGTDFRKASLGGTSFLKARAGVRLRVWLLCQLVLLPVGTIVGFLTTIFGASFLILNMDQRLLRPDPGIRVETVAASLLVVAVAVMLVRGQGTAAAASLAIASFVAAPVARLFGLILLGTDLSSPITALAACFVYLCAIGFAVAVAVDSKGVLIGAVIGAVGALKTILSPGGWLDMIHWARVCF